MKHLLLFLFLFPASVAQAQDAIEQVLQSIEKNNRELQAHAQLTASQKLEAKADNNLSDPSVSYAHLWNSKEKGETIGELIVSQQFDFPGLYATRNKLNRLKASAFDNRADEFRQEKLLQAKEICLDIIMLRQQKELLNEWQRNAEELKRLYDKRLQTGDVGILDTKKVTLELLNIRTERALNEAALAGKLQELSAMNGNLPIVFEDSTYPAVPFPIDYEQLKAEVMATDRNLAAFNSESLVARKQIAVNRSQWLPKLELGYRRNIESGTTFNGVIVGISLPLFENRNKAKIAKAQALQADLQKENAALQAESTLAQLYREARTLHSSMEEYRQTFRPEQEMELLQQALVGGQISTIEYFVEISIIYQSRQSFLKLENQYQKAMARMNKGRL